MLSDILFSAVEQMRGTLAEGDRNVQRLRDEGHQIVEDAALRGDIYVVIDAMERLARRLLAKTVGPFVVRQ